MLAANSMWGLMAPLAKFVMIGGAVSSLVMTDLRVFGAMVLFWIFSFFQKKVEGKNLFFEAFRTGVFSASPIWNF